MGQWKHPGKITKIPSNQITMKGVPYPVWGQPNVGEGKLMQPGGEYVFPGADSVTEYPQMKRGGRTRGLVPMPKPSKKGLASKKYSRSLDATNRLFAENRLFKKPKSRKNKIFDPNAKYYQDGGEQDAMTGMMKARLAYANEFGNPAAKRMINLPDNPYQFEDGNVGTHFMASMDNYAVPQIQDINGILQLGDYAPESNEAIKFDRPEDAEYFAEHYKDVSPGLNSEQIEGYSQEPKGYVENINYNRLPINYADALKNFVYPEVVDSSEETGYDAALGVIKQNPNDPIANVNNPWWYEHELMHHLQNQAGGMSTYGAVGLRPNPYVASDEAIGSYYNRRGLEFETELNRILEENPDISEEEAYARAEEDLYNNPTTTEGEARNYEGYIEAGNPSIFPKKQNGGIILDLTDDEIEEYRKGGYVVEEIDDPSIPVLNAFQKGGDTKRGVQDIPEATIYSDPETKKMQLSLVQQLKAAKNAYQEFTKQNKGKKWKLTSADDAPSDIVTLKKGIQLYKDELKKEKEEISAEKAKLERLKKKLPDNKDIQNLTLKDLNSVKGKIKIEDALRKSDLDASTVAALYTGLRLDEIDYNVKRGYGSDPVYSATATEAEAMKDVPQFVNMVGNVATAIPLLGAAGAMGGVGGIGRGIANTTSALGSGIRTGFNIGSKIINNPFVRGAGKAAAMYGAGKFAMDPSGHAVGVAKTGEDLYTTGRDFVQGKEYNPKNKFGKDKWSGVDETLNVLSLPAAVSGAYRLIDLGKKIPGATTVVEGGKKVLDKLRYPFDYKLTGLLPSKIQPNPKSNVGRITDLLTTRNMFKAATGVLGANMVMEGKDQINNAQNEQQYNEGIRKVFQGLSGTTAVAPAGNMINTYYNMTTPWTIYDFANRTLNPQDFYDPVLYGSRTLSATSGFPRTRLPFPLLKRQDGGGIDEIEIDSDEDIQDLIDQGYIVEEID